MNKVCVLGALGGMGEVALYDLCKMPQVDEIVAIDLNLARKEKVLRRLPNRRKVKVMALDIRDRAHCRKIIKQSAVLINAAWYEFNIEAMHLALALGSHYIDLGGLYYKTLEQLRLHSRFQQRGLTAVLGCGSTPGITNAMAAALTAPMSKVTKLGVYDASHDPSAEGAGFLPPFSVRTMLDEAEKPAIILDKGVIKKTAPFSLLERQDFPKPLGTVTLGAMLHSELATLPGFLRHKGIKESFFKIYYPEKIRITLGVLVDAGLSSSQPIKINGSNISPRQLLTVMAQQSLTQAPTGQPNDFEVLRVTAQGKRDGKSVLRTMDCHIKPQDGMSAGARGVGLAASCVTELILAGKTTGPGVRAPERSFAPQALFDALIKRGGFKFDIRERSLIHANGR